MRKAVQPSLYQNIYNAKTAVESRNTEEVTNQLELAKEAIVMAAEESE
jgi:hypothetical protein